MPGNQNELNLQLIQAAEKGKSADVQRLIQDGADVNAKNEDGLTPLHLAVQYGREETVKSLIEKVQMSMQKIDMRRHHCTLQPGQATQTPSNHY